MTKAKRGWSPVLQDRLSELEEKAARKGYQIHYDLLEAAGLKLKGGFCKIKGEFHLFVDRRAPIAERIEILEDCLNHPPADGLPEGEGFVPGGTRR